MSETATRTETLVGRRAPDFEIPCTIVPPHRKRIAKLNDYRDRWLILMFYPQDFSLVCPTELRAMSERYDEFVEHGADVLAVSTDPIQSHEQWIARSQSVGGLGLIRFPLGSDTTAAVAQAYNVYAKSQHLALRGLFIIDPNSVVQMQVVQNLSVGRRTDDVLRILHALQVGGLCAENWSTGQDGMDASEELKPGNIISHYRIEEKVGAGGFAVVYRAYDRTLQRNVALKVFKRRDGRVPHIQEEARAAAALNHPNVCTVYNIDDSEGVAMIVMEYLVGPSLKEVIATGPTPPEKVARIASQIAAGITVAHDAGVVHGDLKPGNILLTDRGTAKIVDFGLSVGRRIPISSDSTVFLGSGHGKGTVAGTPSYMAPEQVDGAGASANSDVFSFGLIIYELLTGEQSFVGTDSLQLMNQIRSIEPGRFAERVGEPFSGLLRRMLLPDPKERTITMRQVVEVLRDT